PACHEELSRSRYPGDLRPSLIRVGHGAGSGKIGSLQLADPKPGISDECVDLAIQVATAPDLFPDWCEPVLPEGHAGIGSMTMFDKDKPAIVSQDAFDLLESLCRVRYGTQRPRDDGRIDARVREWYWFFG